MKFCFYILYSCPEIVSENCFTVSEKAETIHRFTFVLVGTLYWEFHLFAIVY